MNPLSYAVFAATLFATACAVPPRAGDSSLKVAPVRQEHWEAPALRIHVLSVNGARLPPDALRGAAEVLARHTRLPVEFHDAGVLELEPLSNGLWPGPLPWPVFDGERRITLEDLPVGLDSRLLFDRPNGGIVGAVVGARYDATPVLYPLVEPGVILVAVLPGSPDGGGVTGYASRLPTAPMGAMKVAMVELRQSAIRKRANFFVSARKLWQWTLTHEAGHVLGVPGDASHVWVVPGLGPHCTRPECVMYTGIDWRVVVSGLLHGWPLDFCALCASELRSASASRVR